MHEFIHNDEKIIKVGEPIFFENKTEWIPVTERNKVNDLISRQDAIDAINGLHDKPNAWLDYAVDTIKTLPSADNDSLYEKLNEAHNEGYDVGYWAGRRDYEKKWIPCSERLPSDEDYDETFTVTIQCEHQDGWDNYVTGYADWTPHGWDIQSNYIGQIKVVAWMPLPQPWKGEA